MAFEITAQDPTPVENVGIEHSLRLFAGVSALSGGSKVITIPGVEKVVYAHGESETANAARVNTTSGNTFTVSGTGTDRFAWMALCKAKV